MSRFILGNCIDVMGHFPDSAVDFMSGTGCTDYVRGNTVLPPDPKIPSGCEGKRYALLAGRR